MIQLPIDSVCHGFRVLREGEVPLLHTRFWQLRHETTGATLYYTDRDDGQMTFSVGFRTLPEDSTGVFHILEHSCLDGSQNYKLKEPFVNLLKTSMAVDLNAMTFEDKTLYYFISTNEQDYQNLMSVYMDAVFNPLLLTDRRIFEKEAWHLEPDGNGGVTISGVVFNEMQGNDNQPDYIMWLQNEKQIFPDLPAHACNSGGDPACIPDLTYEQFVETYKRFYSPDNAIFYLSGNMGLEAELAAIDAVLTAKEPTGYAKPAPAPLQAPVVSPDGVAYYQIGDNEEIAGNTHLMLTYVLEADKSEEVLAFSLLTRYLAENTESPLTREVLAAGVGQDFDMAIEGDYRQPMLYFTMGKSDPEHAEGFKAAIERTLAALLAEGLDKDRLRALVDSHETDCRRASLSVRTGFRIMESFLRAHVQYDDIDPVNDLEKLRACMDEDACYFEHLIEKYILQSNHWGLTRCIPSRTLTTEKRERMAARFAAESERVRATEGGYEALEAHIEDFRAYLVAPDSPEAEASVPHLTPADLDTTATVTDMAEEKAKVGGAETVSLSYITDAAGMVTAGLLFELSSIPADDLFYVACLRDALMELPTKSHTIPELSDLWIGLHTNASAALRVETCGKAYLALTLDTPEERLADATALLDEYIRETVFDPAVLRHIFANASAVRDRMTRSGNLTALRLATRALSVSGMYDDLLSGVSAYRRRCDLADRFDANADALVEGLARVWSHLTEKVVPIAYLTGSEDAYAAWKSAIAPLSVAGNLPAAPADLRPVPVPRANAALTIPGEVNYIAEVFDLSDIGQGFDPRALVVGTHIYGSYFWDEIRAKGGAYGAGASALRQGIIAFTSYRDPRVGDTYAVYDRLPDWLEANIPDEESIGAIIVSTVGSSYFAPRSPMDLGHAALSRYLVGMTAEDRHAEMMAILSTTADDFTAYAKAIRTLIADGKSIRTALGSADLIRTSGFFAEEEIAEL